MDNKKRYFNFGLLIMAIVFYSRLTGNENIRTLQFVYIWLIGALSGPIIFEIIHKIKSKLRSSVQQTHTVDLIYFQSTEKDSA